ncbi:MAG: hypothetical protein U1E52_09330 [Geminicoccaceae bacterium]
MDVEPPGRARAERQPVSPARWSGLGSQGSHRDPALAPHAVLGEPGLGLVDLGQHGLGLAQQELAGIGQDELVVDAVEKLAAEGVLELAELLREGGLGDAQLLGGARANHRAPRPRTRAAG